MEPAHAVSIAMCQMLVVGGDLSGNTARAVAMIQQAAEQGADIALLPECCDLGWTDPSSQNQATAVPDGAFCQAMMAAAQTHRIHVCCGLTEQAGDKTFNAAVLIESMTRFVATSKNELDIGHVLRPRHGIACGSDQIRTIGMHICADATAHQHTLTRSQHMGADLILSPSAWAVVQIMTIPLILMAILGGMPMAQSQGAADRWR